MCLFPLQIRNPTRRLSRYGGQPLFLEVPCGKCAECQDSKRLEWHFRAYYQIKECIDNGGYVYYDTLTYSDDYVPHLSRFINVDELGVCDYMCFDSKDWRNFLKNLRAYLSYHYPGCKFTYFLTSEYGTAEGRTHRPHYHILFFFNTKAINPFELSRIVSKLWTFGRTDGLPYQTMKYVMDNIFGYFDDFNTANVIKVCGYISKYITKDSTFQKEIDYRLSILIDKLPDEDYKSLRRSIIQFHRQSQGFGLHYLNELSADDYTRALNGCVTIKDSDKVKLILPLPLYYKRKLFYNLHKRDDKTIYWLPNSQGLNYIELSIFRNIQNCIKRFTNQYINSDDDSKNYIDSLLDGRTLEEFSIYKVLYSGRLRSDDAPAVGLSDIEYNLCDWINRVNESLFVNSSSDIDSFERIVDSDTLLIPQYQPDLFSPFSPFTYKNISYTNYINSHKFDENSCITFRNFDKLYSFFKSLSYPSNVDKQHYSDYIESQTKIFKSYGLL